MHFLVDNSSNLPLIRIFFKKSSNLPPFQNDRVELQLRTDDILSDRYKKNSSMGTSNFIYPMRVEILKWFHCISTNTFCWFTFIFYHFPYHNFLHPETRNDVFAVFEEYRVPTVDLWWFGELHKLHNMIQLLLPIISHFIS